MRKAKVGDLIRIKNYGATYSTYDNWAKAHNLKNYVNGGMPEEGRLYTIRCIGEHSLEPLKISIFGWQEITMLAGIRDLKTKQEYIFGLREKINEYYEIVDSQLEFDF